MEKLFAHFDFQEKSCINRLQLTLLLRAVTDAFGFSRVHDAEIVELAIQISGSVSWSNPNTVIVKRSQITEEAVVKMIMDCVRKRRVQPGSTTQKVVEFINTEYGAKIGLDGVLLLFQRFCYSLEAHNPLEVYNEFQAFITKKGDSVMDRDKVAHLILAYINKDSAEKPKLLKLKLHSQSVATIATEEMKTVEVQADLTHIREGNDVAIHGIESKLTNIESAISNLNKSQAQYARAMENQGENLDVARAITSLRLTHRQSM